jgi:hypothetical protein
MAVRAGLVQQTREVREWLRMYQMAQELDAEC